MNQDQITHRRLVLLEQYLKRYDDYMWIVYVVITSLLGLAFITSL
jgi:hypothetical protein